MGRAKDPFTIIFRIAKDIDRANKRMARISERQSRERERASARVVREQSAAERKRERDRKTAERAAKQNERERVRSAKAEGKARAKAEREHERYLHKLTETLEVETVKAFFPDVRPDRKFTQVTDYCLPHIEDFESTLGTVRFDQFVFSGLYNSVLGAEGLSEFRQILDSLKLDYEDPPTLKALKEERDFLLCAMFSTGTYEENTKRDDLASYRFFITTLDLNAIEACKNAADVEALIQSVSTTPANRMYIEKQKISASLIKDTDRIIHAIHKSILGVNKRRLTA